MLTSVSTTAQGPWRWDERDRGGGQAEPGEGGEGDAEVLQADRPVSQGSVPYIHQ